MADKLKVKQHLTFPIFRWTLTNFFDLQNIPEQKLKAFSIGTMGKRNLSKRELEEQRKREEEEAAAHVNTYIFHFTSIVFIVSFRYFKNSSKPFKKLLLTAVLRSGSKPEHMMQGLDVSRNSFFIINCSDLIKHFYDCNQFWDILLIKILFENCVSFEEPCKKTQPIAVVFNKLRAVLLYNWYVKQSFQNNYCLPIISKNVFIWRSL